MRRLIAAVCALVVLLGAMPVLSAAERDVKITGALPLTERSAWEVELTGADMSVEVPESWMLLTRDEDILDANAESFGFTASDALEFMENQDFYLILYEPEQQAEIYITVYESQYAAGLGELDQLTEDAMARVRQEFAQGYADWGVDSDVTEQTLGDFTYLAVTMHRGQDEERSDTRQLFTVWNGREIYIDLYAGAESLNGDAAEVQNALAASLRTGVAEKKTLQQYRISVAVTVAMMLGLLVQFVGLAMSVFIATRKPDEPK